MEGIGELGFRVGAGACVDERRSGRGPCRLDGLCYWLMSIVVGLAQRIIITR
jgi:hypothetical protein